MAPHALSALKKSSDRAAKRVSIRERSLRIHELSWFRFTTKPCLKDTSTTRFSKLTFHGPHHSVEELMDWAYCDLLRGLLIVLRSRFITLRSRLIALHSRRTAIRFPHRAIRGHRARHRQASVSDRA